MIVAITGTNGAGKGTITEYLINKYGFTHFSARELIKEEILKASGNPNNRNNQRRYANYMRKTKGADIIARRLFQRAQELGGNCVIESIRTVGEAEFLREQGAILIAIDAPIEQRYEWIQARKSENDKVTFEEFKEQEGLEMNNTDPSKQNLKACQELASYTVNNAGTIEDLEAKIAEILSQEEFTSELSQIN